MTFDFQINSLLTGSFVNTGVVDVNDAISEPDEVNNTDTATVEFRPVHDIAMTEKRIVSSSSVVGSTTQFQIDIQNNGTTNATNITITDFLPSIFGGQIL